MNSHDAFSSKVTTRARFETFLDDCRPERWAKKNGDAKKDKPEDAKAFISFKPLVGICATNALRFNVENSRRCVFSHRLAAVNRSVSELYSSATFVPSVLPYMCTGCLLLKFGLLQKYQSTFPSGCKVLKDVCRFRSKSCNEGPYVIANNWTVPAGAGGTNYAFSKNTVIIPCGYWTFDTMLSSCSHLYGDPDIIPTYRHLDETYTMNPFLYMYFKSLYELFIDDGRGGDPSGIRRDYSAGGSYSFASETVASYETEVFLIGELVHPTAMESRFAQSQRTVELQNKLLDYGQLLPYIGSPSWMDVDVPWKFYCMNFGEMISRTRRPLNGILAKLFPAITDEVGRHLASCCVPRTIYDTRDSTDRVVCRTYAHNVSWVNKVGLVARKNIRHGDPLIIDQDVDIETFRKVKITFELDRDDGEKEVRKTAPKNADER